MAFENPLLYGSTSLLRKILCFEYTSPSQSCQCTALGSYDCPVSSALPIRDQKVIE